MSLPKSVQAQIDEANRLQAALSAQGEPEPVEEAPETQETVSEATQETSDEVRQTPEPRRDDEATWEQRYKSYEGHWRAEIERARQSTQAAQEQMAQMQQELRALREQLDSKSEPAPEPGITDADIETFGSDLVGFTERAARKAVADAQKVWDAKNQALMDVISELRGQIGQVHEQTSMTAEEKFFDKLATAVPDWEAVNANPDWLGWLQESDPFTGAPRQALLNDARQKLDTGRVAAMFDAFKATQGVSAKPSAPNPELRRQVSPPKSRAGSTAAPSGDKRIWTQEEIKIFYDKFARGQLDPAEAARTERDLNQAVAEGRVR